MSSSDQWTRGELAERAGVHPETLRSYEEEGLIPEPRRSGAGYRLYGSHYLPRLRFIQRAKNLGFTLREIRELLELRVGEETDCGDVRRMGEEKLANIEQKISDLKRFRSALRTLIDRCGAWRLGLLFGTAGPGESRHRGRVDRGAHGDRALPVELRGDRDRGARLRRIHRVESQQKPRLRV